MSRNTMSRGSNSQENNPLSLQSYINSSSVDQNKPQGASYVVHSDVTNPSNYYKRTVNADNGDNNF